jgi:hypothetical protein
MNPTVESNEEIENEILKFIDSKNTNEIKKKNTARIISKTGCLLNVKILRSQLF